MIDALERQIQIALGVEQVRKFRITRLFDAVRAAREARLFIANCKDEWFESGDKYAVLNDLDSALTALEAPDDRP